MNMQPPQGEDRRQPKPCHGLNLSGLQARQKLSDLKHEVRRLRKQLKDAHEVKLRAEKRERREQERAIKAQQKLQEKARREAKNQAAEEKRAAKLSLENHKSVHARMDECVCVH